MYLRHEKFEIKITFLLKIVNQFYLFEVTILFDDGMKHLVNVKLITILALKNEHVSLKDILM